MTLSDSDYPSLYRATDAASLRGQRRTILALRIRLAGLVVATIGGAFVAKAGRIDFAGLAALVAFVAALASEVYTLKGRPDQQWYEGRAAAESVKTLTWRYVCGGDPFDTAAVDVDRAFAATLRGVLSDLDQVAHLVDELGKTQISDRMRAIRGSTFEARRDLYSSGRIEDQRSWYARKARWNARRSDQLLIAGIALDFAGVCGASLKAFSLVSFDLLGIIAVIGSGVVAWTQAKQHQNLSTSYGIAAQELATIQSEIPAQTVVTWSRFVDESEEAISREHTLWRASRGVKTRPHLQP